MRETEKAPTGAATSARAAENGTACETAHASAIKSTTPPAERQPFRVSDLLLHGAENGIFRRDLMNLTGYRDRELRLLIETERRQGCPILSDNVHGYFLPGNSAERDRCVRSLRVRASEVMETADAIERAVLPD